MVTRRVPGVTGKPLWQRRVVAPIVDQLKQGMTPERVALTIALGLVLGTFPILGATTLLCSIVAAWLRLNQPIIQLVNVLVYPAQLVALLPFYRAGESLFAKTHMPFDLPMLLTRFRDDAGQFLFDFGLIAMQGIVVWCIIALPVGIATYLLLRSGLQVLAGRMRVADRGDS